MRIACLVLPVYLAPCMALAQANDALPREFGCLNQAEITNDMHPSELARSVRACVQDQRYDDAVQVYYTYSSYGLYDQQRVRDESAHVVLGELSQWMFSFFDRTTMTALRASIDKLRDTEHPFFLATCATLKTLGPPMYRPGYMIRYGMMPRKSDDDWQHDDFDPDAAWRKAVVEINACPDIRPDN